MKRSKLELYVEILKTLNQRRSENLARILDEIHDNYTDMNDPLGFLIKQDLVEQRNTGKQGVYKNTQRGLNVLRYFSGHQQEISNGRFVSA
jgi:predicted transcriptional regulator